MTNHKEIADRRDIVDLILRYPEFQYIIEFTKMRERVTTTVINPVALQPHERRRHRRPKGQGSDGLHHIRPLQTSRETRVRFEYTVDAISYSARIENAFIPYLKRLQKGRVSAFWCVEDYHNKDAHPALLIGNLKHDKGDVDWRAAFYDAASFAHIHIGRITPWQMQWHAYDGLAKYLTKSIYPVGFNDPDYLLATSSGTWGMTGMKPELFIQKGGTDAAA